MSAIHIIDWTDDTVTLRTSDYDALMSAAEDAEDLATLLSAGAKEEAVGRVEGRRDHLSDDLVGRLIAGGHPLTIWREHRGLSPAALAEAAGISPGDFAEIESGKDPGSLQTYRSFANALDVSIDDLVAA